MKKAVITGATGAIGIALIHELIKHEIEVLVLCRKNSNRRNNIPFHSLITIKECNLDEFHMFEPQEADYDVFFHLAWKGTTGSDREDMYLQNLNVKYSLDAVKLAKRMGCRKFIGAGSQAEYGRTNEKLSSRTNTFPETGYGIAKLSAGFMTKQFAHQLGMEHNWVRFLSVYGPGDWDESLIMSTIRKLKAGEIPNFTKGEQLWDYLYSCDAAEALRLISEKGIDGKTYVIGSGQANPLSTYLKVIQEIVNKDVPLNFGAIPYSNNQVMNLCADISEVKQDTNWFPKTSFIEGIMSML